jgi:hypothetical protein
VAAAQAIVGQASRASVFTASWAVRRIVRDAMAAANFKPRRWSAGGLESCAPGFTYFPTAKAASIARDKSVISELGVRWIDPTGKDIRRMALLEYDLPEVRRAAANGGGGDGGGARRSIKQRV